MRRWPLPPCGAQKTLGAPDMHTAGLAAPCQEMIGNDVFFCFSKYLFLWAKEPDLASRPLGTGSFLLVNLKLTLASGRVQAKPAGHGGWGSPAAGEGSHQLVGFRAREAASIWNPCQPLVLLGQDLGPGASVGSRGVGRGWSLQRLMVEGACRGLGRMPGPAQAEEPALWTALLVARKVCPGK